MSCLLLKKYFFQCSFLKLSKTLHNIETISSTIKKQQILIEYLHSLSQKQRQQTKNLFDFVNKKIKTGISHKTLSNICRQYFNIQSQMEYNKQTVETFLQSIPQNQNSANLKIQQINNILIQLSTIQGKNSIKIKIQKIKQTLFKLSSLQLRFFLRILSKDIKIGMKDKLFKNAYIQVENNFHKEDLTEKLRTFNPMFAKPLKDIEEYEKFCEKKKNNSIIADIKYDGERTLITYEKGKNINLISRNGKMQNQKYYKIAESIQKVLQSRSDLTSIALDGEILAIDKHTKDPFPFQVLLSRQRKVGSILPLDNNYQNIEQVVYIFDVLEYNGECLTEMPLIKRKQFIFEDSIIKQGEYQVFDYSIQKDKLLSYFYEVVNRNYEGLVLKGIQDPYVSNGSRIHWGKLKKGFRAKKEDKGKMDLDVVLMGADYGKGKKVNFFSSFLVGVLQNQKILPISKVGSGFTDEQLQILTNDLVHKTKLTPDQLYQIPKNIKMDAWFRPQLVVEIDCQQMTRSPLYELGYKQNFGGISLRFPVFKRFRDDKIFKQATTADMILEQMKIQQQKTQQKTQAKIQNLMAQI